MTDKTPKQARIDELRERIEKTLEAERQRPELRHELAQHVRELMMKLERVAMQQDDTLEPVTNS